MSFASRRAFLKQLTYGAVGTSTLFAQAGVASTKLSDNIFEITGAGANILALTSADGVLMVDGGLARNSAEVLKLVASLSNHQPVKVLFNTHWHPEATGANEAVRKAGGKVMAHENTKLWMGTDVNVEWQKKVYPRNPVDALPNDTFYINGKLTFGTEIVEYGILPQAHTDGDIYVYLRQANILMAGDLVSVGQYPILDYSSGGWIGGMAQASKALLAMTTAQTRIIPGSGPVQSRADLEAQSAMLATVMDRLLKLLRQGMSAKDMIAAAPTKEFDAKWGNPELFIANAYPGLWGHVREVGGIV